MNLSFTLFRCAPPHLTGATYDIPGTPFRVLSFSAKAYEQFERSLIITRIDYPLVVPPVTIYRGNSLLQDDSSQRATVVKAPAHGG